MLGTQLGKITKSSITKIARSALRRIRKKALTTLYRWIGAKYTCDSLANDLKALGIKTGDMIFVHSSLSKIGYVEGGASTVINALFQTVGETGTILMPCYTIYGSMKQTLASDLVFDPKDSKVTVGTIPEAFRKMPGVCRSLHPTHSVCAYGKLAGWITEGHELSKTNFGAGTPFHKFMQLDGKVLGLGIDLGPVTFYHVLEDVTQNFPRRVYWKERYEVRLLDHNGKTITMKVQAHDPNVSKTRIDSENNLWIRKFLANYLRDKNVLREAWVGKGRSWIVQAKALYEAQIELVKKGITIYTTREDYLRMFRKARV